MSYELKYLDALRANSLYNLKPRTIMNLVSDGRPASNSGTWAPSPSPPSLQSNKFKATNKAPSACKAAFCSHGRPLVFNTQVVIGASVVNIEDVQVQLSALLSAPSLVYISSSSQSTSASSSRPFPNTLERCREGTASLLPTLPPYTTLSV